VVAVFMTDVEEALFARIAKLVPKERSEVMIAWKLKPGGIESAFRGKPGICDEK
jgi:hypothetical protein